VGAEFIINGRPGQNLESFARTEGVQYGAGLFETIRISERKPCNWEGHIERLSSSARSLGLDRGFSASNIERWTEGFLKQVPPGVQAMKIVWIPGEGEGYLIHQLRDNPYGTPEAYLGFRAGFGQSRRVPQSRLVRHKTLNWFENMLEKQASSLRNLQEHILLNIHEQVAEGTVSNVFICTKGAFSTPSVKSGILPGTMRHSLLQWLRRNGFSVTEGELTVEDLKGADQIYLTNALMGLMPVSYFEGNWYDVDRKLCQAFRENVFPEG